MAFLRLLILVLVVQTVVYVCLTAYLRAARRERLEAEYPDHATDRERAAFVGVGVRTYGRWLAPRLAIVVYAVPIAVLAIYIYVSNSG